MMYIKAKKGLFSKKVNNGLVILSQDEDKIFILNETASKIWDLSCLNSKVSLDDILSGLEKEYTIKKSDLKTYERECMSIVKKNSELFDIFEN